jgi:hypothetical protein
MSKNTLNQLTPEQQQIVISWIAADRDRKPGQPSAITRVRNQFHIETTEHELHDYRFEWQLHNMLDDSNFLPENVEKLMTALGSMDQDRLQEKALSLLLSLAMKRGDIRLLLQVCKINTKNKELDLKKTILVLHLQQTAAKSKPGNANLPIGEFSPPKTPDFNPAVPGAPASTSAFNNQPLALSSTPLSSVLAARVAKLEKTQGPRTDAVVAEIAESILADARNSLKRSA